MNSIPREKVILSWTWGVFEFHDLEYYLNSELDYRGFYAILAGKPMLFMKGWFWTRRLLYIGQAYHQSIRGRAPQPHPAYAKANEYFSRNTSYRPLVMVGLRQPTTRPSEELYNDIECALIHANQPLTNESCKASYTGRAITIENRGDYRPLQQIIVRG